MAKKNIVNINTLPKGILNRMKGEKPVSSMTFKLREQDSGSGTAHEEKKKINALLNKSDHQHLEVARVNFRKSKGKCIATEEIVENGVVVGVRCVKWE